MLKQFATACLLTISSAALADSTQITGAGATFPYPLYVKWAELYQQNQSVNINYQPIGSGGGIQQIKAKTVNFGASDKPLSNDQLQQNHLTQFPTVVGGVVTVVNLPDHQKPIILSGVVLAKLFLGEITQWNDPQIAELNPDVTLPKLPVTVIHRSDGSGTTFLFTHYLNEVSSDWKTQVGSETAVSWPAGVGGKGNEGVAAYVQHIKGSIGYVEYAYAKQNHLDYVLLKNQSGHVVAPSLASFQAAAKYAHWNAANHFAEILTNQPGTDSWPIVGATFILLNYPTDNAQPTTSVLKFFNWALTQGQASAIQLDYVALPDSVVKLIQKNWNQQFKFTEVK
ncbi:MAG: phosphate ABC transporter substrate-binding protein PstS [Proteobacteria bacterium]|nr:phosphate ABC transporter substrate-binding protein PstS [Pseudomonadota bacterium]